MKSLVKLIIKKILQIFSPATTLGFVKKIIYFRISSLSSKNALIKLLDLDNFIYQLTGQFAITYGQGVHVKKRLINYIDYFEEQILKFRGPCIDIGCGDGELAKRISENNIYVLGIDKSEKMISKAKNYESKYLNFLHIDLEDLKIKKKFNIVILSNVLEHIDNREFFLKKIIKMLRPNYFVIRVPTFDRDWRVPLKKELGIEWRLDSTHFVEYRDDELIKELSKVNINIIDFKKNWGEIWLTGKVKS